MLVPAVFLLAACGQQSPPAVPSPPAVAAAVTTVEPAPRPEAGDAGTRGTVTAMVLGTALRAQDADDVRYLILATLTRRYAEAAAIEVTAAEIDAWVAQVQRGLRQDRERYVARREELAHRLADGVLSSQERAALSNGIATLDAAVDDLAEPAPAAGEEPAESEAARREIAAAFIRQWKINRALYRQYGGRIVYQQGGPEPLDAYRIFLEEARARGEYEILDPALEAAFWRYYRSDAIHDFYAPGSAEEARAFAQPPWQTDP